MPDLRAENGGLRIYDNQRGDCPIACGSLLRPDGNIGNQSHQIRPIRPKH